MVAITPYMELKRAERGKIDDPREDVIVTEEDVRALAGLGAANEPRDIDGSMLDPLAKPHTELTRLLWARTLIAKSLVGSKFRLVYAEQKLMVEVVPPSVRQTIPWSQSSSPLKRFSLFSTNSKMECPTFDLPAGIGQLGGACPGAAFAQSTVPESILQTSGERHGQVAMSPEMKRGIGFLLEQVAKDWEQLPDSERKEESKVLNLNSTVCTRCYASGGKYGEAVVQFAEVARMALVTSMLAQNEQGLVDLLVRALEETQKWENIDAKRHGIRPVRVHSSGDFFSPKYASMWLKVAWKLNENAILAKKRGDRDYLPILLWAPTRTHVLKGWFDFWKGQKIPPNFMIRPSAYSVGDPAPFINRESPTGTAGTSVLFSEDAKSRLTSKRGDGDGTKFDWQCGVYALDKGEKTCIKAIAPDGKVGCRACWVHPEKAVNYVIH